MKKRKEYDDIHIPFVIKELIIIFVIVTFHWVFMSFSASEIHLEHRPKPVLKVLSSEEVSESAAPLTPSKSLIDTEISGGPSPLSSPQDSLASDEAIDFSPRDPKRNRKLPSRSLLKKDISPMGAASVRPEKGSLRKTSSSDTGGSSSDRLVTEAVKRVLFAPQSNEISVGASSYEIPDQKEPSVKTHKRPLVLSFDGGGYRGLFGAEYVAGFLHKSQEIRAALYPDMPNPEATDLRARANILVGTSAGGVNALSYMMMNDDGSYRYSLAEVVRAYPLEAKKIFDVSWMKRFDLTRGIFRGTFYDKKNLYEILRSKFLNSNTNQQTKLSELGRTDQTALILATRPGARPEPRLFRSWLGRTRLAENFDVWKVAAATTAAPIYFGRAVFTHEGETFCFDDGGLFANNPIYFAYSEAQQLKSSLKADIKDFLFLSIGTGLSAEFVNPQKTQNNSVLQSGIGAIVNAPMSASDAAAEKLMTAAFLKDHFKYHRIQPFLPGDRKKLDRHGKGQTQFFHDLAAHYLGDLNTINLVKDLDEDIPDLPDKSVLDTSNTSETQA